jgi:hypothetical protein
MKPDQISSYAKASGICVEVGTWQGGFTDKILSKPDVKKVYCVDPYKHFTNNEYPDGINELTQTDFDVLFNKVQNNLTTKFGSKVQFVRKLSVEASKQFDNESLDFVYIDGNHDYKYVLEDLKAWYPKIKTGGYLCGDDVYSTNLAEHDSDGNVKIIWSPGCWGKYGTYKAIVDFGKKFELNQTQFSILKLSS